MWMHIGNVARETNSVCLLCAGASGVGGVWAADAEQTAFSGCSQGRHPCPPQVLGEGGEPCALCLSLSLSLSVSLSLSLSHTLSILLPQIVRDYLHVAEVEGEGMDSPRSVHIYLRCMLRE